jgi:hypothetical protein
VLAFSSASAKEEGQGCGSPAAADAVVVAPCGGAAAMVAAMPAMAVAVPAMTMAVPMVGPGGGGRGGKAGGDEGCGGDECEQTHSDILQTMIGGVFPVRNDRYAFRCRLPIGDAGIADG